MHRSRWILIMIALATITALVACGAPTAPTATPTTAPQRAGGASASSAIASPSPSALVVTPTVTVTPAIPTSSATPSPVGRSCNYAWTGPIGNEAESAKLLAALVASNFSQATARVVDSGEKWLCTDGTSGIGISGRSLEITLPVANLADRQALGTQLAQILTVASPYAITPSDSTYFVTFTAGGGKVEAKATKVAWEQARKQGLTGAALLDALQGSSR